MTRGSHMLLGDCTAHLTTRKPPVILQLAASVAGCACCWCGRPRLKSCIELIHSVVASRTLHRTFQRLQHTSPLQEATCHRLLFARGLERHSCPPRVPACKISTCVCSPEAPISNRALTSPCELKESASAIDLPVAAFQYGHGESMQCICADAMSSRPLSRPLYGSLRL